MSQLARIDLERPIRVQCFTPIGGAVQQMDHVTMATGSTNGDITPHRDGPVNDGQMWASRTSLEGSGIESTKVPGADLFAGRNPA